MRKLTDEELKSVLERIQTEVSKSCRKNLITAIANRLNETLKKN